MPPEPVATQREAEDEAEPNVISYSAGTRSCEKAERRADPQLLCEKWEAKLEPKLVGVNAGDSVCDKSGQWQQAPTLLNETWKAKQKPDVISSSAGTRACEKAERLAAQPALCEKRKAKLEPERVGENAGHSVRENG